MAAPGRGHQPLLHRRRRRHAPRSCLQRRRRVRFPAHDDVMGRPAQLRHRPPTATPSASSNHRLDLLPSALPRPCDLSDVHLGHRPLRGRRQRASVGHNGARGEVRSRCGPARRVRGARRLRCRPANSSCSAPLTISHATGDRRRHLVRDRIGAHRAPAHRICASWSVATRC